MKCIKIVFKTGSVTVKQPYPFYFVSPKIIWKDDKTRRILFIF